MLSEPVFSVRRCLCFILAICLYLLVSRRAASAGGIRTGARWKIRTVCVCACLCMCVCTFVSMFMCVSVSTCMCLRLYLCGSVSASVYAHVHLYLYVYMRMCTWICISVE